MKEARARLQIDGHAGEKFLRESIPTLADQFENELCEALGITGTLTLALDHGRIQSGALPAKQLIDSIQHASLNRPPAKFLNPRSSLLGRLFPQKSPFLEFPFPVIMAIELTSN
jgi:hypothetical protein